METKPVSSRIQSCNAALSIAFQSYNRQRRSGEPW